MFAYHINLKAKSIKSGALAVVTQNIYIYISKCTDTHRCVQCAKRKTTLDPVLFHVINEYVHMHKPN